MPVEVREWISPALASPDLVLDAQPPAQPHRCMAVSARYAPMSQSICSRDVRSCLLVLIGVGVLSVFRASCPSCGNQCPNPGLGALRRTQVMRTALLTATALVALSSLAIGQNQLPATTAPKANAVVDPAMPKVRANAPGGGRLHYDIPCRVSSVGTCITEPLPYPPYRPRH